MAVVESPKTKEKVLGVLKQGLEWIEENRVQRAVVAVNQIDERARPEDVYFIRTRSYFNYPKEGLSPDEIKMMRRGDSFEVIAFVSSRAHPFVHQGIPGVEFYQLRKQNGGPYDVRGIFYHTEHHFHGVSRILEKMGVCAEHLERTIKNESYLCR